jgi:predicted component of type VI protein secretion system
MGRLITINGWIAATSGFRQTALVPVMDAKLIVVGGKASKGTVSLKPPTIVGRSREAGLTVAHPMISRRHAEIYETDGLLMIRDLGSLNGTRIDGRRIKEAPLPPEAEFTIGPLTFRAQYEYKGDLSKLPAPVFVEEPHGDVTSTAAWGESPEFEIFNEPAKKAAEEEKPAKKSSGDPFEDLLNDL